MENVANIDRSKGNAVVNDQLCNIEAEQQVLGSILSNNQTYFWVNDFLRPEHFHDDVHSSIYEEIGRVLTEGRSATPQTLKHMIKHIKSIAPDYLERLLASIVGPQLIRDYARTVLDYYRLREMRLIGTDLCRDVTECGPFDSETVMTALETSCAELALETRFKTRTATFVGDVTAKAIDASREAKSRGTGLVGVTTGLQKLDRFIGGWRKSQLIICGGRPGMGKTTFASSSMLRTARAGHGVGFISLEMDDPELVSRMLCDMALEKAGYRIAYEEFDKGRLDEIEYNHIDAARAELDQLPIIIDSTPGQTMTDIGRAAQAIQRKFDKQGKELSLLVIDHLTLIKPDRAYRGNKVAEVGEISNAAKDLAKKLDIPVLMLCQLSREVEKRDDKRPMLSDLRWSGEIEQDADIVMFAFRPEYYHEKEKRNCKTAEQRADWEDEAIDYKDRLELIVEKQRAGRTGTLSLWCAIEAGAIRDEDPGGALV